MPNLSSHRKRKVDPAKIVAEVDIITLEALMESFTFSHITEEDLDCVSAARLLKAFVLFQLMLEYQVDANETLTVNVNSLSERLGRKSDQLRVVKQALAERDAVISTLKRETRQVTELTPRPDPKGTTPSAPHQEQRLMLPAEDVLPIDSGLVHLSVVVTSEGLVLVSGSMPKLANPTEF